MPFKTTRPLLVPLFVLLTLSALLSVAPQAFGQGTPVYRDPQAPLEARVSDLFGRLTQDEKLSLLTGTDFTTTPIPRLGVPAMGMADAGQGVRGGTRGTQGPATLFPSGVTMASTWDPALVGRIGEAIGAEALNKGTGAQVLLGPAVNIHRSPLGGRNGEYFSEDPYLAARLAVGYVRGMQSTGCAACLKHYACNNEEVDRGDVNVRVDERTLREIYLPAFEAGVKEGHVWTVMAAYNRVNGHHMTANEYLLTEVLKKGWGWDGMVMSDWGAVHETAGVVNAGNDLEMPGPGQLSHDRLVRALQRGQITQAAIDENVRRVLRAVIRVGLLDGPHRPDHSVVNSPAHQRLTFEAASQGIVLLKNAGGVLPLNRARIRSIAVIGPAATDMQYGAAGSPGVQPFYSISPLAGIQRRAGSGVAIRYVQGMAAGDPIPASALPGLRGAYFTNRDLQGVPALTRADRQIQFDWNSRPPAPGVARTNFSVRWTGRLVAPATGRYTLALTADDGCRLFLDGRRLIDHWVESSGTPQTVAVNLVAGRAYGLRVEYFQAGGQAFAQLNWTRPDQSRFSEVARAAAASDVVVVCVNTQGTEGEGTDRPSMALPGDQDALIRAVAAANKKTIVVLNNGTPVLMTGWLDRVPGLIETWFPGQEGGNALAAILFGDVNPSGKLPDTLGARREDYPDYGHFPGTHGHVDYVEGIYVGYRHFDKKNIRPLFPFGYGLSYTTFRYAGLRLSQPDLAPDGTVTASVDVTNTGRRAGAEVVELYVHDPNPKIDKPVRELKGFQKVALRPGQTKTVSLTLAPRALAYCDVPGKQWKADAGDYDIEVGASSRDIRQRARLRLAADYTEPIPYLAEQQTAASPQGRDLARDRPIIASSVQEDYRPQNAVDGDDETRWSSLPSDPQWIAVDLGKPTLIDHVRLVWEAAYASAYAIQVSVDGKTWTDVYATQDGQGDEEQIKFAPVQARWVRMYGTKRATQFGYSLFSFEVYAPGQ
ncbi:MAG: glycoside hydrolase family 3 C-terminal domain-containing protein [Armatimonadetes bacterium]|nr:glycoside hydrolase family 3 C-terminal domain-containing protein [Armatimonadota bacterium]